MHSAQIAAISMRSTTHRDSCASAHRDEGISFGPFRLYPKERAIERDGVPLLLGSRALDILVVLVERAGEVVSQRDLTTRVWRQLVVTPSSLRVHIVGLRRALGDSDKQSRYIANVPGQGYCFVAPIERAERDDATRALPSSPVATTRSRALPAALARMVGRDEAVRSIAAALLAHRFLSVVGAGGMGKTTVAVCVAHALSEEFAHEVCFVDFGAITDPAHVATTIASSLGLTTANLMESLRDARMLLVLDNCEHVIDTIATLAEQVFSEAPRVHLLATSREALRVEGEHAYLLPPLETPPQNVAVTVALTAVQAQAFPAVRLFIERATACINSFELSDEDAPIVADICSRLGGIALAIELAAGRVGTYGVRGTAELLTNRLGLHWHGRRTALPRHQTLHALLDWSYGLLSDSERLVLQRLSVFAGDFTLEDAQGVVADASLHRAQVVVDLGNLVCKSLLSAISDGSTVRYRLLETTRAYAAGKSQELTTRSSPR